MIFDGFDDDDGVIDDDADCEHEAEECEVIETELRDGRHRRKRPDDGDWHGDQRN